MRDNWDGCIRLVDEVKEGETAAERESRLRPRQMSSQQIHHLLGHQSVTVTEKTEIGYTGFRNICNRAYITYAGVYVIGPIYVMAYM